MEQCSNTVIFMEKFRLLLEAGETLALPVQGSSMVPFLVHKRDMVWVKKPDRPLKTGDVVLYRRDSGQYILHRIHRIQDGVCEMIGDAHSVLEPGIREDQIFGRVIRAWRKGKNIAPGNFCWEFFARVWIRMVPVRRPLMKLYCGWSRLFGR